MSPVIAAAGLKVAVAGLHFTSIQARPGSELLMWRG